MIEGGPCDDIPDWRPSLIELSGNKSRSSIATQGKLIFCRTPAESKPSLLKKNLLIHGGASIEENQRIELSPAHCPLRWTPFPMADARIHNNNKYNKSQIS